MVWLLLMPLGCGVGPEPSSGPRCTEVLEELEAACSGGTTECAESHLSMFSDREYYLWIDETAWNAWLTFVSCHGASQLEMDSCPVRTDRCETDDARPELETSQCWPVYVLLMDSCDADDEVCVDSELERLGYKKGQVGWEGVAQAAANAHNPCAEDGNSYLCSNRIRSCLAY